MIVAQFTDPFLLRALGGASRPDEDVVGPPLDAEALARGFPRLVVRLGEDTGLPRLPLYGREVPRLVLTRRTMQRWEAERRSTPVPGSRFDLATAGLLVLVRDHAAEVPWVDRVLGELGRASGGPVPECLRGLARRTLEFPSRYGDLGPLAELSGVGRDAVRARFRRRGIEPPSTWLRWFRVIAAVHLLSDRTVTVQAVARRLGFSNAGNFCRLVRDVAGMTPTEARAPVAGSALLVRVAEELARPGCREGWESLGDLFLRGAA